MEHIFCALGCAATERLYIFPSKKHDEERRKAWLDFFDMEEPNIEYVFACNRHFSHLQTTAKGLRTTAVPDIPITCDGAIGRFRRKPKNWRKNVIVVTPRDPEFTIYRHETGVFPQTLFNSTDIAQPFIQTPVIKTVSCSMSTQTNTSLCGLVQISNMKEEYHLNCFYCSEIFAIEKWSKFVDHLKKNHFQREKAFRMSKFLLQDHDYTSKSCLFDSPLSLNEVTKPLIQLPLMQPVLLNPIILPSLYTEPHERREKSPRIIFKDVKSSPPPLLVKPHHSNDKPFNISLADQLIKLLHETVLSPNFLHTEEDNILIIKNTGSDSIDTSTFLKNFMNTETNVMPKTPVFSVKSKKPITTTISTRPVYTINYGQRHIPSRRQSLSRDFLPPLPKVKRSKYFQKRIAQQTLKNINFFENTYKTVKARYLKVVESENDHLKDANISKMTEQSTSNSTPLSRCLKRTITEKSESKELKSTEIVFEFTPRDIVVSLIESMKNYPVLWEFHDQPFNRDYNKATVELCRTINAKWSLNITLLKMRRSLNRILRFYRFMLSYDSIDKFEEYFDKCALFLPSSVEAIPRARCVYCSICYKKDSELRKHIREKHKGLKWHFKCQNCLERFRESDEYELHKRLPHYEEIFKCEQCSKRFNRRNLYSKHIGSHQRTKKRQIEAANRNAQPLTPMNLLHICNVCHKQFTSEVKLNRHKIDHNMEKFKCDLCPKEFVLKKYLKLHLKRHRKELDYMCEVCGKCFILSKCLREHMDTHTGAKVTCKICNLKLRKCSLARHLRVVHVATEGTIESTFRAKSYSYRKYLFPRPAQTRKRPSLPRQYNCKICEIHFVRLKQLKDHNKEMHSNVKRTPCKICNIEFMHMQNLKRHYRYKHKLHMYQIFKLVYQNADLNATLSMKAEELATMVDHVAYSQNNEENFHKLNDAQDETYFAQETVHSDELQDEIMKAVEEIDNQEIIVDDDHSVNDFFTDFLNNSYK